MIMPHRTLNADELAGYLHIAPRDVERLLRESDIPHEIRGERTVFRRTAIDAWASKRILGMPSRGLGAFHDKSLGGVRAVTPDGVLIPALLPANHIDLALKSKTRPSLIRDIVALADGTGKVHDPKELLASVEEREALCPTALPGGLALLHVRHHVTYRFEGSFIVLGRTIQAIPFGAPDGRPTQLFFLICCEDDRIHLHTLARLCLMAQKTDLIARLLAAQDRQAAYEALVATEKSVLPEAATAPRAKPQAH